MFNKMKLTLSYFLAPEFNDKTNVSTILRNTTNELSNSIVDQAMQYAFSVGAASLRENFFMKEKLTNVIINFLTKIDLYL